MYHIHAYHDTTLGSFKMGGTEISDLPDFSHCTFILFVSTCMHYSHSHSSNGSHLQGTLPPLWSMIVVSFYQTST